MIGPSELMAWLEQRRRESGLRFEEITWDECAPWRFENGALIHDTGGFFAVRGLSARSNVAALNGFAMPIIDQPEIGILAFLLRETDGGYEWLLQAKTEPGNVNGTQFAPSVQATESNFERRHGGEPTEFLDLVKVEGMQEPGRIADVRQSEQGSMFANKYNRNVAHLVGGALPLRNQWRWAAGGDLRALCLQDFALNTDARSVLSSTPWRYLSRAGAPFRGDDAWTRSLAASYAAKPSDAEAALSAARQRATLETAFIDLNALPDCIVSANEIRSTVREPALIIRPYAVEARDREVKSWRQPLVSRDREEEAWLVCAAREGVLHFFFRFSAEIGFRDHKIQFGPSMQSDVFGAPAAWLAEALDDARVRAQIRQSDEGGRFMKCITTYRIAQIEDARDSEDGVWLTLADVERLASQSGGFTNEARSLISMLLAWA